MRLVLCSFAALVLSSLAGCAASAGEAADSSNDALETAATVSCGAAKYSEGLAHYKKAVAAAKQRIAKDICNDDGADGSSGMVSTIVSESAAAVTSCAAFEQVIAESIYAKPIRDQLADNLSLPLLTGKIDAKTWSGLEAGLAGKTVYGPAAGVYGNDSKIEFAADGKATIQKRYLEGNVPVWLDTPATWALGAPNAKGGIALTLTADGVAVHYTLVLVNEAGVQDFVMTDDADETKRFDSLPSECEA